MKMFVLSTLLASVMLIPFAVGSADTQKSSSSAEIQALQKRIQELIALVADLQALIEKRNGAVKKAAVQKWEQYDFKTYNDYSVCSGDRYVGYSERYEKWVGAELCGTGVKYKLFMSNSRTGTYYQIGDTGGHGQDHCELVNPNFTLLNDDDVSSGTCFACAVGNLVDVQDEPVYRRSKLGEAFVKGNAENWGELTTNYYSCGLGIGKK